MGFFVFSVLPSGDFFFVVFGVFFCMARADTVCRVDTVAAMYVCVCVCVLSEFGFGFGFGSFVGR